MLIPVKKPTHEHAQASAAQRLRPNPFYTKYPERQQLAASTLFKVTKFSYQQSVLLRNLPIYFALPCGLCFVLPSLMLPQDRLHPGLRLLYFGRLSNWPDFAPLMYHFARASALRGNILSYIPHELPLRSGINRRFINE